MAAIICDTPSPLPSPSKGGGQDPVLSIGNFCLFSPSPSMEESWGDGDVAKFIVVS